MIKISTEFDKLDYTFNRSLSTVVTLPYNKDDVLLGVNELVNGYNFNSCVEKLQSNASHVLVEEVGSHCERYFPSYHGYYHKTVLGKLSFDSV